MRKPMDVRPEVESLESMVLLSAVPTALPQESPADVSAAAVSSNATLTLTGTASGRFHATRNHEGTTYDVNASGLLTPLGQTTVTGNLHVTSGISMGPPNGTLTLTTAQGTLTVQIPKSVMIPAGLPTATSKHEIVDTYAITGGTGAYKGDSGSGVVEFTFHGGKSGHVRITFTTLPPTAAPMVPATS